MRGLRAQHRLVVRPQIALQADERRRRGSASKGNSRRSVDRTVAIIQVRRPPGPDKPDARPRERSEALLASAPTRSAGGVT